ncbi:protein TRACHEARY ELEMENT DIFFERENTIATION-RELATED 7A-like [Phragmites australis]|uniref:protein TRACHEARY ELEMENT DIFFERENTIATION-RELATED 7A-like n=1 Tax=Phragmites australis TaxID=29695 RepID=UPI002D78D8BF|nr:protein TRACHEARY ELEMENT DIFFERENTIATION-RELATED 7A-like [Phragmites australis]
MASWAVPIRHGPGTGTARPVLAPPPRAAHPRVALPATAPASPLRRLTAPPGHPGSSPPRLDRRPPLPCPSHPPPSRPARLRLPCPVAPPPHRRSAPAWHGPSCFNRAQAGPARYCASRLVPWAEGAAPIGPFRVEPVPGRYNWPI